MSGPNNRKRPLKLNLNIEPLEGTDEKVQQADFSAATATTNDSCLLDSTVKVTVGDSRDILISPDSLIVTKQLGRGQYGIVERVLHQATGYQFAIKRVALMSDDNNERRRLLMDVDILVKGTECKNIIKFYGALIWEGDLWILMELMDCSLDRFYRMAHKNFDTPTSIDNSRSKLQSLPCNHCDIAEIGNCNQCNPIPENVIGRIAADVLNALSYLYSIKVIHRDIKPSNILINKAGVIKLCDFGISGYLVNSVARTYEAGCRPYMAPERIDPPKGRTGYDIKSDVWSFGITLLEIANGRYPYNHARDFFEQLKLICTDEPPKLASGRFSSAFEDFMNLCLNKDYELRPKYNVLEAHDFITKNKMFEIECFTQRILSANNDPELL